MMYVQKNKGITLVELLLYMSIFAVLLLVVCSTAFYVQKIFSDKRAEYLMRIRIYEHLHLMQQYAEKAERIDISTGSITLYMYDRKSLMSIHQYIEEGKLVLEYIYDDAYLNKKIYPYEFIRFEEFSFERMDIANELQTISRKSLINAHILWKNPKQKLIHIYEALYIPNTS